MCRRATFLDLTRNSRQYKPYIKSLKTILEERTVDHPAGLKALCLLAKLAPNELDRTQAKSWLDSMLKQISSTELDSWLEGLRPLVPWMQDELVARIPLYVDTPEENVARDNCIRILCAGANPKQRNWLDAAWGTSPETLHHWKAWLPQHSEEVKQQITASMEDVSWVQSDDEEGENETRKIAQRYLLRYVMGDSGWEEILKQRPDPRPRTYFFHRLAHSKVSLTRLSDLLLTTDDAGMLFGSLLCLGFAANDLPNRLDDPRKTLNRIQDLYLNHVDSGVHSACLWTLINMKEEEFIDASQPRLIAEGLKTSLEKGRRWHVSTTGDLFVHVEVKDESVHPKPWKVAIAALPMSLRQKLQMSNGEAPTRGPAAEYNEFDSVSGQFLIDYVMKLNNEFPSDARREVPEPVAVEPLEESQKYSIDYFRKGFRIGLKSEIRLLGRNQAVTARSFGSARTSILSGFNSKIIPISPNNKVNHPWDAPTDLGAFWMCYLNEFALGGNRSNPVDDSYRLILNGRQVITSLFPNKDLLMTDAWANMQVDYAPGRVAFFLGFVEED